MLTTNIKTRLDFAYFLFTQSVPEGKSYQEFRQRTMETLIKKLFALCGGIVILDIKEVTVLALF